MTEDTASPKAKTQPARKRSKKARRVRVSQLALLTALAIPLLIASALLLLLLRSAPRSVAAAPRFEPHPALLDAVPSRRVQ